MKAQPALATTTAHPGCDQELRSEGDARLRGHWLRIARAAWLVLASLAVAFSIAGIPAYHSQLRDLTAPGVGDPAALRANLARAGLSLDFYAGYMLAVQVASKGAYFLLAALLFRRKSAERMALFVAVMLVLLGATSSATRALTTFHPAWRVVYDVANLFGFTCLLLFFYLFPDGRFVPRWTRWLAVAALALATLMALFPGSPLDVTRWPLLLNALFLLGWLGVGVVAQVYRYRRISGPTQRQQAKWVVFGFAVGLGGHLGTILLVELFVPGLAPRGSLLSFAAYTAIAGFLLLIPLSLVIAILRYRLFDIDMLINRALVYGALSASVVGLYALVVGTVGALLQARGSFLVSLVAAGLVAVLFQPLRERLQRAVNRLTYGERDEPYAVLSRLGRRLEATLAPDAVLPAIVETVAAAFKLPYAAITLKQDERFVVAAAHGPPVGALLRLPLIYRGETVGELLLAPRAPGEAFGPADRRLLDDLARQAGVAAHAVRLTADLHHSRERLVTAREEERRRLRRDLHDGLGPRLSSLALQLAAARNRVADDPVAADLLANLKAQTHEAVADIRRLVYALRPPALDELGLVPAIREHAARYAGQGDGLRVTVEAPDRLSPLPAAVEVAAYRIALEALTNVARHAQAHTCAVRLALERTTDAGLGTAQGNRGQFSPQSSVLGPALRLEIVDDGRGIAPDARMGAGLLSMRERAAELGGAFTVARLPSGGTRVCARLPLPATEEGP